MRKTKMIMLVGFLCLFVVVKVFAATCGSINYYETVINIGETNTSYQDSGDTGTSAGQDGNVKRVEVSLAGQESWGHARSGSSGQKFDIQVKLTNKGDAPINDAEVEYYLSGNLTFNEAMDTRLGQDTGVDIPAGGTVEKHLRGISITQPGTYYIFCKIEAPGDVNHSNDFSRSDDAEEYAKVSIGWPDFVTRSAAFQDGRTQFAPTEQAKLSYVISNIGAGTSPIDVPVVYFFNFSPFAAINIARTDLEPGESKAGELIVTMPATPGDYSYSVCPDGYNYIVELNELGNCQDVYFKVDDLAWLMPIISELLLNKPKQ